MSLFDHNKRPVPICNVIDEDKHLQFYVTNPDDYVQTKKELQNVKSITLAGIFVFILLLCIFTLNLSAAGWSAGNILTFGIVIAALYVITLYGKKWMHITSNIAQMVENGNPCVRQENDKSIVYCNRQ